MTPFQWIEVRTPEQAAAELQRPGGLLKAGGVDVVDRLKEGLEQPERLVNLGRMSAAGLREVKELPAAGALPARLRLGALLTLDQLSQDAQVRGRCATLAAAAQGAATPQVRALATLGGNLLQRPRCWYFRSLEHACKKKGGSVCFAQEGESDFHAIFDNHACAIVHPSATATALSALEAVVVVQGGARGAERRVPIAELFQSPGEPGADVRREHRLAPDDILTAVEVPLLAAEESAAYLKVKQKQSFDWPLAEVAVFLRRGARADARIVLGAAAPVPWRAKAAEDLLRALLQRSAAPAPADLEKIGAAALAGARPLAKNGYKLALFTTLVQRAITQALQGRQP